MATLHKKELKYQLWRVANALRGSMNPDEFRNYILGFIFYKYLSDKMENYADDLLKCKQLTYRQLAPIHKRYQLSIKNKANKNLGYFLYPHQLFGYTAQKMAYGTFSLDDLHEIFIHIEEYTVNEQQTQDLYGLFSDIDLNSIKLGKTPERRTQVVSRIFKHLSNIRFTIGLTDMDILGDAYEFLLEQFASGSGKKAGESYTPPMVSRLLAKIVTLNKDTLRDVYDPTCGSGSLLLNVAKEIGYRNVGRFVGQEKNPTSYNLTRMNMILHGISCHNFDIVNDDTLENPGHKKQRFEAVVANPPFSLVWNHNPEKSRLDGRFNQCNKLPPNSKADYAFVLHMLTHLDKDGVMAVILPHGALYRGGSEIDIRRYLIEQRNCLDAVIGLPPNLFYNTAIPTCILIFKKSREHTNNNILFIDASRYFKKSIKQNYLQHEDIERIISIYQERNNHDRLSYVASLEEIKANDYNLNIPFYIDSSDDEELLDLASISKQIRDIKSLQLEVEHAIALSCLKLNIQPPF